MGWVTVSEIWLFVCLFVACIFPVIDGRHVLSTATKLAWRAVTRRDERGNNPVQEVRDGVQEASPWSKSSPISSAENGSALRA